MLGPRLPSLALACAALACATASHRRAAIAAVAYDRQCQRGDPRACAALGSMYADGVGVPRDDARAFELLVGACREGDVVGWVNLGTLYSRPSAAIRDDDLAAAIFGRACAEGVPLACANLGALVAQGRGAVQDEERARALFARSCTDGSPQGCFNLAARLEFVRTPESDARAAELYQRSCDLGWGLGCERLATLRERGAPGVPRDAGSARELFSEACELGRASACARFGGPADEPAPPDTTPRFGWLDDRLADCTLAARAADLESCWARTPGAPAQQQAHLSLGVAPDGSVASAAVSGASSPALGACVEEAARGWRFPRPRDGTVRVERTVAIPGVRRTPWSQQYTRQYDLANPLSWEGKAGPVTPGR